MLVRMLCQMPSLPVMKYCLIIDTPVKHKVRHNRSLRVVVREDTLRSNFDIILRGRIFPFEVADCRCSFYDSSPFSFDFDFRWIRLEKFFKKKSPLLVTGSGSRTLQLDTSTSFASKVVDKLFCPNHHSVQVCVFSCCQYLDNFQ